MSNPKKTNQWPGTCSQEIEVEIRPGACVRVKVPDTIPQYMTMSLQPTASGRYQLVPFVWSQHVRMTEDLPEALGLGISTSVFYRLLSSGFVESSQAAPHTLLVDLVSLLKHLKRTRRVPGKKSWWTPERLDLWKATRAGISAMVERDEEVADLNE